MWALKVALPPPSFVLDTVRLAGEGGEGRGEGEVGGAVAWGIRMF